MSSLPEHEIIKRAVAGDMYAFRQLVEKHQGFAFSLSYRFVGCESDAEDIVQEAFVRLWKNLPRYRYEVKLTTWLYKIIINLCLDFLKSREVKRRKTTENLNNAKEFTDLITPQQELENSELRTAIIRLAEKLTPKQRAVFVLRDLEDLPMQDISDILSMSRGNVKSNLYYARLKMSGLLREYYQEKKKRNQYEM